MSMGRPRARSQSLSSSRLCGTTRCQRTRWTGHVGRKEASFLEERGGHVHEGEQEGLSLKCYMVNVIFLRVLEGMRVCGKGTNITFQPWNMTGWRIAGRRFGWRIGPRIGWRLNSSTKSTTRSKSSTNSTTNSSTKVFNQFYDQTIDHTSTRVYYYYFYY